MLKFTYAYMLLAIPLFLLYWWKFSPVRGMKFSSTKAGSAVSRGKQFLADLPRYSVFLSLLLGIVMLAEPVGKEESYEQLTVGYRFALVFDKSGSMGQDKKDEIARTAAKEFIKKRDLNRKKGEKDIFAVLPFDGTPLFASGVVFTTDHDYVASALSRLKGDGGSTAIGDAIIGGLWYVFRDIYTMESFNKKSHRLPSYKEINAALATAEEEKIDAMYERLSEMFGRLEGSFLIVVTDGESNVGIEMEQAITFASRFGMPIFVIGIGGDLQEQPPFIKSLEASGGAYFHSKNPAKMGMMYQQISERLPTKMQATLVVVPHSYRIELGWLIFGLLLLGGLARATFLVIEGRS